MLYSNKRTKVHLDIVGTGDGKRLLEKRIKKLNIQNNVTFIGYIDSKNMLNYLSHYTGFVLCSRYETFGYVYLEAILAGLPVICAKNSAIDGYFSEKFFTSVKFNDYISIAESMLYIIEQEAELKLLLKDYVKSGGLKQFSCQEVIEKYQRLIKDISPEEEI